MRVRTEVSEVTDSDCPRDAPRRFRVGGDRTAVDVGVRGVGRRPPRDGRPQGCRPTRRTRRSWVPLEARRTATIRSAERAATGPYPPAARQRRRPLSSGEHGGSSGVPIDDDASVAGAVGCPADGDRRSAGDLGAARFTGRMWRRASAPSDATAVSPVHTLVPAIRVPGRPGCQRQLVGWMIRSRRSPERTIRGPPPLSRSPVLRARARRNTAAARDPCSPQKPSVGGLNSPRRARFAARDSSAQSHFLRYYSSLRSAENARSGI